MDGEAPAAPPSQPPRAVPRSPWYVRPFLRALVFVILAVSLMGLAQAVVNAVAGRLTWGARHAANYALFNTFFLLESWLLLRVFDRRSYRALGLWFYRNWARESLTGIGIGAGLVAVVVAILVAGRLVSYQGLSETTAATSVGLAGLAGFFLLAAAFEEILFRGYAFQRLVESFGRLGAVLTFSALFGLGHLNNPSATALSTANTVLAGVLLSVAYLKTRALWMPIGLHWAWNFLMGPILSLPVSGARFQPMLFKTSVGGPAWLSGGRYGPEGSVVLTLACVAAIVCLAQARRIAPSSAMQEVLE